MKLLADMTNALQDNANLTLLKSITGLKDANQLFEFINTVCIKNFNSPAAECLYIGFSIGASVGLKLENGRKIFTKINKNMNNEGVANTDFNIKSLNAASQVQDFLHRKNFPCPAVMLHPFKCNDVIVAVYEFADRGIQKDAHDPVIRREMAEKFAELIRLAEPYRELEGFKEIDGYKIKALYPKPHNALFDFSTGGKDAERIDEIALKSKNIVNSIDKNVVLGHSDWSMKNVRFAGNKINMVYDWDSLSLQDEYHLLGIAAAAFTTTWDIPVKITPSQEEAFEFVAEYEKAKGKKFSRNELLKISACTTSVMCYTARCELSADPENVYYEGSYRQTLYEMNGENYLRI